VTSRKLDVLVYDFQAGSISKPKWMVGFAPQTEKAWKWFQRRTRVTRVDRESGLITKGTRAGLKLVDQLRRSKLRDDYGGVL